MSIFVPTADPIEVGKPRSSSSSPKSLKLFTFPAVSSSLIRLPLLEGLGEIRPGFTGDPAWGGTAKLPKDRVLLTLFDDGRVPILCDIERGGGCGVTDEGGADPERKSSQFVTLSEVACEGTDRDI